MLSLTLAAELALPAVAAVQTFDVVVYGGTAGGVAAAVASAREVAHVALLEAGRHLGGMSVASERPAQEIDVGALRGRLRAQHAVLELQSRSQGGHTKKETR